MSLLLIGRNRALFNRFPVNVSISYSLKTSENQGFFGVFRRSKMGTLVGNGLMTDDQRKSLLSQYIILTY